MHTSIWVGCYTVSIHSSRWININTHSHTHTRTSEQRHTHICAHSSLSSKGKTLCECIEGARTYSCDHLLLLLYVPGPVILHFSNRESENNDPNNVFVTATAAFVRKILSTYQRTHTQHRRNHSTFYNEALIACSFARFLLLCGILWVFDHASSFLNASEKIQPGGFFLSARSLASLFAYFAFLCHLRTQVHSKTIISFLWRYVYQWIHSLGFLSFPNWLKMYTTAFCIRLMSKFR